MGTARKDERMVMKWKISESDHHSKHNSLQSQTGVAEKETTRLGSQETDRPVSLKPFKGATGMSLNISMFVFCSLSPC